MDLRLTDGPHPASHRALALLAVLCFATPLAAEIPASEGPPLNAEAFDALTLGKTWDTYDPSGLYGIEEFLPGQRSIWRDADGCSFGRWEAVGDQICFYYEDQPERPVCWVYKRRGAEIHGWYQGNLAIPPVRLIEGTGGTACEAPSV